MSCDRSYKPERQKTVAVLGSTGSIGTQALDVVARHEHLSIEALAASSSGELLLRQAIATGASKAALVDLTAARRFSQEFREHGITLFSGEDGLLEMIRSLDCGLVLNAIVGSAGLAPTVAVIEQGMALALANKESLVAGGDLVMRLAKESSVEIIPVDSEHSAIFQCLAGEEPRAVKRLVLTASGGPFRDPSIDLETVRVEDALSHPTWSMGRKVTVDSATLMNKGLEVIEAMHLFGLDTKRIDVLVHPQSIVHSMVEMIDGSFLAQLGVPDMRIPIQYALTWPHRLAGPADELTVGSLASLSFEEPDTERFPSLRIAYDVAKLGGTYPAVMNAANEEAVNAFLAGRIRFIDIPGLIGDVLGRHRGGNAEDLYEIKEAESAARKIARAIIDRMET